MPSVLFWSGQPGGTAEYRSLGPGRALRRRGWDVEWDEDGIDVTLAGRVKGDPDILVLSRVMGDYLPDAVRRIVQCGRTKVVFDTDDWFAGLPAYNKASKVAEGYRETMHQAMREADLITVSTPELAEGYRQFGPTVVLPNYLDPDIWRDAPPPQPRSKIHVGWLGAFEWRAGDVDILRPWLPDWLERNPDVAFVALGCGELPDYLGIDALVYPKMLGQDSWLRPYSHLPHMLATLDVGLVPLTHNRFNQAKSWCKGMEYNACGVPAVASPSREYRKFIQPGVNGYLVRHEEWGHTLDRAIANLPQLQAGAKRVAERMFIDQHIDLWIDAYEGVKRGTRRLVHL